MSIRTAMKTVALDLIERHPRFSMDLVLQGLTSAHAVTSVNVTLQSDCRLGRAGEALSLPLDTMILPQVLDTGAWEPEIIDKIAALTAPQSRYNVIDVGANSGLFARQILNACPHIERLIAIEPHPRNASLLRQNLSQNANAEIFNIGLGERDGVLEFYEDRSNSGNYSFYAEQILPQHRVMTAVTMRKVDAVVVELALDNTPIIWKSDTQGYDTIIVACMPDEIWRRVNVAAIEITPARQTLEYIPAFLQKLQHFTTLVDASGRSVDQARIDSILRGTSTDHIDIIGAVR